MKLVSIILPPDVYTTNDQAFLAYVTHPPQNLTFNTSVLIISSGPDGKPAYSGLPACAPNNMSNDRFYECLPGPKWLLNSTDYGHADMFDDVARTAMNTVCATCSQLPMLTTCNFAQFRQDEANTIVNFIEGILSGVNEQQYLTFVQNPDPYFNSRTTIKSNVQQITPSNGFCQSYS
ncbi:unnamed protein product [Rotaria sp. Silwood1]|nr:unnamed protein product [Rotaria sp. Silwood1]CAF1193157.1 unnamed protein product [Rotaria sp. Silwood1]CAF3455572.1 unnamed protein product [Rotaria sp. Silwood1]CAF4574196.1 unnamed protein product [Rotaria sp. Silwood1]